MSEKEDAIKAILRLKRKKPDCVSTKELNDIQRRLEEDVGVTGVELCEEYAV